MGRNNMNKIIIFNLIALIFLMSFISPSTLTQYDSNPVNEEFFFCQTCQDSSWIILSNIKTPNSTEIINSNMTSVGGGSFCYNYTPTQIGRYDFAGISDGCLKTFAVYVDITPNGKTYDTGDSLIRIFVSIFFILMMVGFNRVSKNIDYEKWYEGIKQKYITRNFVKWSLAAIGYNIMINSYIVYFLLGLPIMLILMDLVFIYNITSITLYMQSLLYVYIFMVVVLGIVFLGYVQEWFIDLIEEVQNIDWGVDNDK